MIKTGFYEKEITPPLGCSIPGYFNLRLGSDVKDRMYAKAMVMDNGIERIAVLGLDSLFITTDMREKVTARVNEYTGIKAENILLSANHSHTAMPLPDRTKTTADEKYLNIISDYVSDTIILASKRLMPSSALFGIGQVRGISFVRNYYMKNSTPTTNPGRMNPDIEGPVTDIDPDLPVLYIKSENGNPMGAIVCFACHQDCVGGTEYSGDYSSSLAKEFKRLYGEDFVTLFMAGTCGNINHFDVTRAEDAPDHYVMMGKILAGEASKVIASGLPVEGDTLKPEFKTIKFDRGYVDPEKIKNAQSIIATVKPTEGIKIAADGTDPEQYNLAMSQKLMDYVNGPSEFEVPLQVLRIGDILLYGFPTEIFCQFGKAVKEASPSAKHIVAAVCNGSFGYVPTEDIFYDTIYESRPGSSRLDRKAGGVMAEELIEMAKKLI